MLQIGPHIVANQFSNSQINEHFRLIKKLNPPYIVVVGADDYQQALAFALSVSNDPTIRTRVIFRDMRPVAGSATDNGRLHDLTATQWMNRVGEQYIGTGLIVMVDNETIWDGYGLRAAELIGMANGAALDLCVGTLPTHNAGDPNIINYSRPMFQALADTARFHENRHHVVGPHIYYALHPSQENLDGFRHVKDYLSAAWMETNFDGFNVCITEYGRLKDTTGRMDQANDGWQGEGISGTKYARELYDLTKPYPDWAWTYFSRGPWGNDGSFGDDEAMTTMLKAISNLQPAPPPPIPHPLPTPEQQGCKNIINRIVERIQDGNPRQ